MISPGKLGSASRKECAATAAAPNLCTIIRMTEERGAPVLYGVMRIYMRHIVVNCAR